MLKLLKKALQVKERNCSSENKFSSLGVDPVAKGDELYKHNIVPVLISKLVMLSHMFMNVYRNVNKNS